MTLVMLSATHRLIVSPWKEKLHNDINPWQGFLFGQRNDKRNSHFGRPVTKVLLESCQKLGQILNSLGQLKLLRKYACVKCACLTVLDAITDLTNRILLVQINMKIAR